MVERIMLLTRSKDTYGPLLRRQCQWTVHNPFFYEGRRWVFLCGYVYVDVDIREVEYKKREGGVGWMAEWGGG